MQVLKFILKTISSSKTHADNLKNLKPHKFPLVIANNKVAKAKKYITSVFLPKLNIELLVFTPSSQIYDKLKMFKKTK